MPREDARSPQAVTVTSNSANFWRFISVVFIAAFAAVTYFVLRKPIDTLGDPSDQFIVKHVPKLYSRPERLEPEERDVFQGFRTSFLPPEELVLARREGSSKAVYEGNVTSDILIWDSSLKNPGNPTRVKRKSHFSFTSEDYDSHENRRKPKSEANHDDYDDIDDESELDDYYDEDKSDNSHSYEDDDDVKSIVPESHVDRGPLDDVIEQVRGQPELEEEEMISSAHVYKPSKSISGIHSFWKGQGDRESIRTTQANIMKQYMDAEADPCHDFYQYACGNWAVLNPIPADKAGYDTFEILRENLDAVLKDLLEFKPSEHITSKYPGAHLDIKDNFICKIKNKEQDVKQDSGKFKIKEPDYNKDTDFNRLLESILRESSKDLFNKTSSKSDLREKTEIVNRIRRYLDKKSKRILKPFSNIRNSFLKHNGKTKRNKLITRRFKRHAKRRTNNFRKRNRNEINRKYLKRKNIGRKLLSYQSSESNNNRITRESPNKGGQKIEFNSDDPAKGDAALKARFLFQSCMNYDILKKRGHQPLLDLLDILGGWPILNSQWNSSNFDWLMLMAKLRLYNNDILISEWVGPDIKNSDEFIIQFDQTSLGLPTRDYFLQDSNKIYLEAYKNYLVKIATLLGGNLLHVQKSADELIDFEIKLAKITSTPEDRRNISELYRRMPLRKLEELVPEVQWTRYLCIVMNRTVHSDETIVLFALNYVRHLVQLIKQTEPNILSNYLLWRFVRHRVNNLDDRFQSAKQQFYFILFGREQAPPRWKNCISQVNSNMGMALGSMFVRQYFDEMSKNDTLTMTREIQQSFRELLSMINWIDDKTKSLAAQKVDAMMLRIGYPDFILNKKELDDRYREVKIHPDKFFENILNILQHLTRMEQLRIGQPVNKTLWNSAPAVVNAYYSRNKNQIMFPAGILQPPFYHRHFPRSLNYGGIGVVIGHEITHGFDDKGRLFDCYGNLHRWWSDSAIEAFHQRAQCLIDQYGQYVVPEVNMKLNGVNTQGENIADNGGVKQAFRAYLRWLKKHGSQDETLPGLNHTHTQLFFLNFAQVWCGAMRPEAMRNKLKTAVHSPGRFRVIGTLSNSHDFAKEFRCPPGSQMNPVEKCNVW
ncbi:neprilysin-4-like isoform X2 [Plodia interpunctella]|uniref:neprilysin-4-like isoform X2 n=1 Tax=Plodia interpunctella TaxID=58824 RepID=UPI002368C0E4|nr:neprilysin-4-like isoform X2 [Plodia interpunctella]